MLAGFYWGENNRYLKSEKNIFFFYLLNILPKYFINSAEFFGILFLKILLIFNVDDSMTLLASVTF